MNDRTQVRLARGVAATVGFRYEHGLVLFDASGPAGEPLVVELDTCTSPNAVRDALAVARGWPLGAEVAVRGPLARAPGREAEVPLVRLGGLEIEALFALTDPLGGPAAPDVMLGERFLREVDARLDFARREATFSPPGARPPRGAALRLAGASVPWVREGVAIAGVRPGPVLLDTGFNGALLLAPRLADEVGFRAEASALAGGYGGPAAVLRGRVAELAIGPFRLKDVEAYRPAAEPGPGAPPPYDDPRWAAIGNRVFEGFAVELALAAGLFALEPAHA